MAETLGSLLSGARSQLGWSLRDAERTAGVNHATVSQIETGKIRHPSIWVLARLAAAYGLPVAQLAEAAGHGGITQRLVLDEGASFVSYGIWTCAGCSAFLAEGLIHHAPGCPEMTP